MNKQQIEQIILAAIQEVAPEIERDDIEVDEDIRESCDLDSMDFLNYLIAIKQATGVNILEPDYKNVMTYQQMSDYLAEKLNG